MEPLQAATMETLVKKKKVVIGPGEDKRRLSVSPAPGARPSWALFTHRLRTSRRTFVRTGRPAHKRAPRPEGPTGRQVRSDWINNQSVNVFGSTGDLQVPPPLPRSRFRSRLIDRLRSPSFSRDGGRQHFLQKEKEKVRRGR